MDDGRVLPEADRLDDAQIAQALIEADKLTEQPPTPTDPVALLSEIREHHKTLMREFPSSRSYDSHAAYVKGLTDVISILVGRAHVLTFEQAVALLTELREQYAIAVSSTDTSAKESLRYYAGHIDGLTSIILTLHAAGASTHGNNDTKVDAAS